MEFKEINSANMTNKIMESISRTKDESPLGQECQECNQEIEELYEEYMNERDYEQYRFRCQKCGQERKNINTRNGRSIDETLFQKFLKRKWWLLCIILVLVTVGTVVGLSIHFIEPTKEPGLNETVLILSTKESSNVPMVITSTGES